MLAIPTPSALTALAGIAAFGTGSVVGSFVALVADRWPRGEEFLVGRSHCRDCGRRLRPANLIPIVSYARQRGRCRWCHSGLPIDLLIAELAGGAIGLAVLGRAVTISQAITLAGFGATLLLLALLDARHLWLPDILTLPLGLAGLGLGAAGILSGAGLVARLAGAALGYGTLEALRRAYRWRRGRDGLGGGDPKLLGAIGGWLGVAALPGVVLIAALLGLGWAGLQALRGRPAGRAVPIPLGSGLAVAALLWLAFAPAKAWLN